MYRYKTITVLLAALLVLALAAPALALPSTDQAPAKTSLNDTATPAATISQTETETAVIAVPNLDDALADADKAVRQAQADRIRQELDTLGDELESLNTEYLAENQKLATIEASLNETREQVRWFEAELEAQRQILNDRLANIYKHGDMDPVEAIINNASFSELFTRLSLLLKIGEQDAELLGKLRDQKMKIEEAKNSLDQLYAQQKEITVNLDAKKKAIEEKMRQEAILLANIDGDTKALLEQEESQRKQEQVEVIRRLTTAPVPNTSVIQQQSISIQPGSIAFEALQYLGVPYVWGGDDPQVGLDCSGLVRVVFKKFGIDMIHFAASQAQLGVPVEYDQLQPGDLVFFGAPIHHVGIYLGDGYYIHAPKRNDVVKISRLSDRRDFACARRIISFIPQQ